MNKAKSTPKTELFWCDFLNFYNIYVKVERQESHHWRCCDEQAPVMSLPRDSAFLQLILFYAMDALWPPWGKTQDLVIIFGTFLCTLLLICCIINMADRRILPRFFAHLRKSFWAPKDWILKMEYLSREYCPASSDTDIIYSVGSFLCKTALSPLHHSLSSSTLFSYLFLMLFYHTTYFAHLFYCLSLSTAKM